MQTKPTAKELQTLKDAVRILTKLGDPAAARVVRDFIRLLPAPAPTTIAPSPARDVTEQEIQQKIAIYSSPNGLTLAQRATLASIVAGRALVGGAQVSARWLASRGLALAPGDGAGWRPTPAGRAVWDKLR